jgi:DNA primase
LTVASEINFADVVARTDLAALISADIGAPLRGGRWCCPFHDDRNPDLSVGRDGKRFKCWACGANGTALDYLMLREGIDVVEAARVLDGATIGLPARRRPSPAVGTKAPPSVWEDAAWQSEADAIVSYAESVLWGPEGRPALEWLRDRGLRTRSIRQFRLGFLPEPVSSRRLECLAKDGRPRSIWAPRGVAIPWLRPGSWYDTQDANEAEDPGARWVGINIRRLADGDVRDPLPDDVKKYHAVLGSTRGFGYPWGELLETQGTPPAMLVEGEFDSIIVNQQIGHLVYAVTAGGATQTPHPSVMKALENCSRWLICADDDESGDKFARTWIKRGGKRAIRILLPHGKDVTDFHVSGGDLNAWLRSEAEQIQAAMRP